MIPALHNKEVRVVISSSGLVMGEAEKALSKEKLEDLWSTPSGGTIGYAPTGADSLLLKAELMLKKIDNPGDTSRLNNLIHEVRSTMASGVHSKTESALDRLTDLLFELESQY